MTIALFIAKGSMELKTSMELIKILAEKFEKKTRCKENIEILWPRKL